MSQPTWDPDSRRWLFEGAETPAPRRNRRRPVDVIDRSGTDDDQGVPHAERRSPSLGAELTRVGFGAREPRPGDRRRGGPERYDDARPEPDQGFPAPEGDRRDGGWSLLDPNRPDPLDSGRPDHDGYSDAPWYDRRADGRPAAGDDRVADRRAHRSDAPEAIRPGEFDRTWSTGLAGPGDRAGDPRAGAAGPGPNGHGRDDRAGAAGGSWSEYDLPDRGRHGPGRDVRDRNGFGPAPVPDAAPTGRRAAPDRPVPVDGGGPDGGRRPRTAYEPERGERGRPDPGVATGERPDSGWRPPAPGQQPDLGADGYGRDPRSGRRADARHGRGAGGYDDGFPGDPRDHGGIAPDGHRHGGDPYGRNGHAPHDERGGPVANGHGRPGRHGPDARGGLTVVGGGEPGGYAGPGPDAYAPAGPARTGRHGGDVPEGFGPEAFDGDGYNLDGLGRDGYDRDGFDLYGFDREGYDRHGFDREGYDRDGYPADVDAYGYDEDEYAAEYGPGYGVGYGPGYAPEYEQQRGEAYGYAAGHGPDGYRPGRRRAYDEHDGYYDDDPGPEGTLTGGEMPAVEDEPEERGSRASRRGSGDKERRRWPWMVGAAAAAAAVAVPVGMSLLGGSDEGSAARDAPLLSGGAGTAGLGASGAGQSPAPGAPADGAAAQPTGAQVVYEVNGAGKASSITFGRGDSVAQVQDAGLPWKQDSPAAQGASDYTLSAVSGGGELSCKILLNGAVIAEDSAKGDYAAVSCTGRR